MFVDIDQKWDDAVASWRVGQVGGYLVHITPMIVNHRVVLTPVDDQYTYDIGWCYDSLADAVIALAQWQPTSGERPPGFKKEVALLDNWDLVVRTLRRDQD
jgi:hypothetical protein